LLALRAGVANANAKSTAKDNQDPINTTKSFAENTMSKTKTMPSRNKVKQADTWDLASLFADDAAWEKALLKFERKIVGYEKFRGKLGQGVEQLVACLKFDLALERVGEQLGVYAFLKTTEDQTNSHYQGMQARFGSIASQAGQTASYIRPELMAISQKRMNEYLADRRMKPYRLMVERMIRYKKHTLGKKEEELLAMQAEMAQAASKAFRQLTDADMKFGTVKDEQGVQIELTSATFSQLLHSPKRAVRKKAFEQFYEQFSAHQNTLSATLCGSIQKDVYYAKARGYESALSASLFADNVPAAVYDNLIEAVHGQLPAVHEYYQLRRRKMKLRDIHQYDTYVPILSELDTRHTWKQAVKVIIAALEPLGSDYQTVLEKGLSERWCDRYPNQGKQSGAFSCGTFDADPFIMMNYKPEVLDDVFTLAHEAGHSMHSQLSASNQPFQYYDYTIFVAEVASTFNEQLLSRYMMDRATDDRQRAYLINREIDSIRGTIIRQTMFAEFEKIVHAMSEAGEALTLESFREVYGKLLKAYFGDDFVIDEVLSLECLRIPHFYRAFYVYKYATGLSASLALSQRVLDGGKQELGDYLGFLKSGCREYPLDLLRGAGVDMEKPEPVATGLEYFGRLVRELGELL